MVMDIYKLTMMFLLGYPNRFGPILQKYLVIFLQIKLLMNSLIDTIIEYIENYMVLCYTVQLCKYSYIRILNIKWYICVSKNVGNSR